MIREKILDVVVSVVSIIELVGFVGNVVSSVSITGIGVAVEVNDIISHIVLFLEFFIIVSVSVGELVRVLLITELKESYLSSSISAATEAKIFNDIIFTISSILNFLVISRVTITEEITSFLGTHFGTSIEHGV